MRWTHTSFYIAHHIPIVQANGACHISCAPVKSLLTLWPCVPAPAGRTWYPSTTHLLQALPCFTHLLHKPNAPQVEVLVREFLQDVRVVDAFRPDHRVVDELQGRHGNPACVSQQCRKANRLASRGPALLLWNEASAVWRGEGGLPILIAASGAFPVHTQGFVPFLWSLHCAYRVRAVGWDAPPLMLQN